MKDEKNVDTLSYDFELAGTIYPILMDFLYHYGAYKEMMEVIDDLPGEREFWVHTIDAHLCRASVFWCMIFGAYSNTTHWQKFSTKDSDRFLNIIYEKGHISKEQWDLYGQKMRDFRDKYVAHRTREGYGKPVSDFTLAYQVALWFDEWARGLLEGLDMFAFARLEEFSQNYREKIRATLEMIKVK